MVMVESMKKIKLSLFLHSMKDKKMLSWYICWSIKVNRDFYYRYQCINPLFWLDSKLPPLPPPFLPVIFNVIVVRTSKVVRFYTITLYILCEQYFQNIFPLNKYCWNRWTREETISPSNLIFRNLFKTVPDAVINYTLYH